MKFTCRHCGEDFKATKDEAELYENGFIGAPDLCNDCFNFMEAPPDFDYEQYSDADPGL